jgi:hypothetical protein
LSLAVGACGGEQGLRALVTADGAALGLADQDAWLTQPFDWIEIAAAHGDKTVGRACLMPRTNPVTAVAIGDGAACADAQTEDRHAGFELADWGFADGQPRSVTIVSESDRAIRLRATAGFGAHVGPFSAEERAEPSVDFPDVTLALAGSGAPFLATEACPIRLAEINGDLLGPPCVPGNGPKPCPGANVQSAYTRAMACVGATQLELPTYCASPNDGCGVGRVLNIEGGGCVPERALRGPPRSTGSNPLAQKLTIELAGHFSRCQSGDWRDKSCVMTADCDPPRTEIVLFVDDGTEIRIDVTCVPPSVTPLWLAHEIDFAGKQVKVLPELHQEVIGAPTERACFFEVNAFAFSAGGV